MTNAIVVQVDNREPRAIEILRNVDGGIDINVSPLPVGDFVIPGTPPVYIERKTWADLASSMTSSRLEDQLRRLIATGGRVLYVIEGAVLPKMSYSAPRARGPSPRALRGLLLSLIMRHGVGVMFTRDVADTCELIIQMARGTAKDPTKYARAAATAAEGDGDGIAALCKPERRSDALNPQSCFPLMLSRIPGIGHVHATSLSQRFGSMRELCALAEVDPRGLAAEVSAIPGWGPKRFAALVEYLGLPGDAGASRDDHHEKT